MFASGSKTRTKRVTLTPTPGFVVKTTNQEIGVYTPSVPSLPPPVSKNGNILEVAEPPLKSTPVNKGFKIFVNVAYDAGVPEPPRSSEAAIRKAMAGDENAYFVPVIVSDGREVLDKSGKPSLVFDVIFNPSIQERADKDGDYKLYMIEIALERVEEKSGLVLGRELGTPNIKSKGPLEPRSVLIPAYWSPKPTAPAKPLVEEISTSSNPITPSAKSISSTDLTPAIKSTSQSEKTVTTKLVPPKWDLELENTGKGERFAVITIQLPKMTRPDHTITILDVEPNRLLLSGIPHYASLDVPLYPVASIKEWGLDVESVSAEWRVQQGVCIIRGKVVKSPGK